MFFCLIALIQAAALALPIPQADISVITASSASATATSAAPASTGTFVLPVPQEGPGPTFDATATRAATGATIRNGNLCFDINDKSGGDDRLNNIPIALKPCTGDDGQKFDLITKGEHNTDVNTTLIVSSQTFECVDRRSGNNHQDPGLFACGGRADGSGQVSADQQYVFDQDAASLQSVGFPLQNGRLNNGVGDGNTCLTAGPNGLITAPCSPPNFAANQLWTVG